jgi:subtilisin family serine protease
LRKLQKRALPHVRSVPILVAAAALVALLTVTATSTASRTAYSGSLRVAASSLTPTSTYEGSKTLSGYAAKTDRSLLGLTSSKLVSVMIKYDVDATASYNGRIRGLKATSPRVTGKRFAQNRTAVAAYNRYATRKMARIGRAISSAVPGVRLGTAFRTVYGGVAARVPANRIARLLKVPGVAAVQRDSLRQPQDDNTAFIGATGVWPSLGGSDLAAQNVKVGIIDTGVWPEHPMLADTHGLPAVPHAAGCQFGDGSDVAHLGPTFTCNNKLIGAYAKTATYMAIVGAGANEFCNNTTHQCSARDSEGHGTHTMTTAAGACVSSAPLYGVERGPVCGIAPGARVIMYRVCLEEGCFSSDSVSAVAQAITDGVSVINFSIGGGAQPYTDPVELAFLDATNAGISVNASAGNDGPGVATAGHGGPWVTTVAASTGPREFGSVLHLTADGGATFDKAGVTLTNGISSPTPVVLAESIAGEDARCQTQLPAGAAAGKIVACQRGVNARVDKGFNVFSGGAVGMILYNPIKQDVETDNHWLPAIHLDGPNADLLAFINTHTNVMATWAQGTAQPGFADMMAAFSSRGPLGDWIKPDVTAPGVQVLAGTTPQPTGTVNGPPGNLYMAIAGTSMSSPHSAGVSALVKAAHPSWTPAMIKSALMTSSVQSVVKEDGVTPANPFDDGAGSLRADRAVSPTLVFDETYADYVAAGTDPLHRIDLNLASINAPTMAGEITTKRTAINVSGKDQDLEVSTTAPAGASIAVSDKKPGPAGPGKGDKKLHAAKNKPLDFWVTISAPTLANGQYFGQITLDPKKKGLNEVVIPVAFNKRQGAVTLTHACSPLTVAVNAVSHCTANVANFSQQAAQTSLEIRGDGPGLKYSNPSAGASLIGPGDGVRWSGTLSPAVPPQVTSITDVTGDGPDGGYLDLSLLGVGPVSGVGDDTISNFNVPTFYYGGEPYSSIGVVSNGYIVIGGGTSADLIFTPQHFPAAGRPNNVLAPLWTDLNPSSTGAGQIRVAVLSGGVNFGWVVVDWAGVKNFGNSTTHSFEVWIQIQKGATTGPASEAITYSYGPNLTFPGDGTGLGNAAIGDPDSGVNWGAENRTGTSGVNIAAAPANGSEWSVNTTGPQAGGTASVTYDAAAKKPGSYDSTASMSSNQTAGISQVVQTLTVTP